VHAQELKEEYKQHGSDMNLNLFHNDYHENIFVGDCGKSIEKALPVDQVQDFVENINTIFLMINEEFVEHINSHQIQEDTVFSSLPIAQNKELVESEVYLLQLEENMFLPFYFNDILVVLNASNETFIQKNNQQF